MAAIQIVALGLAKRAALQAMNKSSPERPTLFLDFVLPPGPKHLFPNLWIADPHGTAPHVRWLATKAIARKS